MSCYISVKNVLHQDVPLFSPRCWRTARAASLVAQLWACKTRALTFVCAARDPGSLPIGNRVFVDRICLTRTPATHGIRSVVVTETTHRAGVVRNVVRAP